MRKYLLLFLLFVSALSLYAEIKSNGRVKQEVKSVVTYDLSNELNERLFAASVNASFADGNEVAGEIESEYSVGYGGGLMEESFEEEEIFGDAELLEGESSSSYLLDLEKFKIKTLLLGKIGYSNAPQLSYGVMAGQMYNGIGWYFNFRSNYVFLRTTDLVCSETGKINGEMPFYTGREEKTLFIVTGGVLVNFLRKLETDKLNAFGMYVGGGYGKRELQLEMAGGRWVKYPFSSATGVSVNLGIFGSFSGITLSAGLNTINFKYFDFEAGVGFLL